MPSPAISVVIPSYNHARFIGEAVDSVLSSTFHDLELVIVDDGSTDDTVDVLVPFRADPRVAVHAQENRGAHAALNVGLALARGEILFILNSDDAFEPDRIARMVSAFNADQEVVIGSSWIQVVDGDGASIGVKRGWSNMPPWPPAASGPSLSATGHVQLALLESNFVSTTSNVAFRRSLIRDHTLDFLPLRYTHDWDFILSACRHGRLTLIEEPLVRYRVHGENTIREGVDRARGEMRFEVMWTVVRHARATIARAVEAGADAEDLEARMWRSLPRFGCDTLLAQLLTLRGPTAAPPASYDAMLEPSHPFRASAVETLAAVE